MSSGQDNQETDHNKVIQPFIEVNGGLMPALHAIQETFGFIDNNAIKELSIAFNCSKAEVIDVLTYYDDFNQKPEGKNVIRVCQAEACQSQNCKQLLSDVTSHFNLNLDETSSDLNITLKEVFCLGNCELGPSVMINDDVIGEATAEKIIGHLKIHKIQNNE